MIAMNASQRTITQPYSRADIAKLGNAIIFLAERLRPLSKTKLLKLVYLLEEASVRTHGLPFFNMRFAVWKHGPVAKDLFIELSAEEPVLLSEYINRVEDNGITYVVPKLNFSDDEFSDNEIDLLDFVAETYRGYSAQQLVELTHRKHSLWYQTARETGVLEFLEKGQLNATEEEIDFIKLLEEMPEKAKMYSDQREFLEQSRALKL
jgi:uncharacterized phage-associated protein